jgi:ABC-type amino acid transport substrate-binding protein
VSLPSEGFQVGVVRGQQVLFAQGLEIDLARAIAARLGLEPTVFLQSRFSAPYMMVDQGVLLAQTVKPTPRTIAALRSLRLCALRKTTGAEVAQTTVAPKKPVLLVGNVPTLMLDLQTGRCDADVYDAPALGTLKARAPDRYGPFAGIIETREECGIAFPRGSALVGPVNRALSALMADGTLARLQRKWLKARLDALPVLR